MAKDSAFDQGKTVLHNKNVGGEKAPDTEKPKYAAAPFTDPDKAKKISDVREKFAKNADKPTTASADSGEKDLPSIIKQIDPQQKGQQLPQLYQTVMQMTSIMGMGSGMGAGGGGAAGNQGQTPSSMPSGIGATLQDSFTGALAILTKNYGFERVIEVMVNTLDNGGINQISGMYQQIVKNSIGILIKVALYYGPLNIPVSQYDETIYGDLVPEPVVAIADVPEYYQKQYYTIDSDPYPGYIQWLSQDKITSVYTRREPGSYVFSSANQEIFSDAEQGLADDLDPYAKKIDPLVLTPALLNQFLLNRSYDVETDTLNNTMGNNAGNQNSGGGNNMAGMLGGQLKSLMQMFQTDQLGSQKGTALQSGNIQQVLQQFQKDMGLNNQLFELANGGLGSGMGGMLGGLGGMGGIGNIMGGFGSGGGGIGGILGNLGGGNLMGSFGSFGGKSGGGGGGAGSGFPSASVGSYTGGQVSEQGQTNIRTMLNLLGLS